MKKCVAPALVLAAVSLGAGPAAAQWVDGKGASCRTACSAIGANAMASGVFKNGQPYYICAANANGEGMRPGYNLEPEWSNACVVGWGGKEEKIPGYACLCDGARAQAPAPQGQAAAAPPPAAGGLTAANFKAIGNNDLDKWNSSGCSFSLNRGKDLVALFDPQDQKKTAVFKIDGKLQFVSAGRKDPSAYWNGTVNGYEIRMIKGKVDPKFKNDGGSQGGEGRLEWNGPGGQGSMPARWEEGC